ncbi:hypothetical protein NMY22_g20187 [Coprinellus aureogranulatus]|nr:hypothetical protein NMY22_g20187 [Coprinellus aureogranulatus]
MAASYSYEPRARRHCVGGSSSFWKIFEDSDNEMSDLFSSLWHTARGNEDDVRQDGVESSSSDETEVGENQGLWQRSTGAENTNLASRTVVEGQWGGWGTGNVNTRRPTYGPRPPRLNPPVPPPHPQHSRTIPQNFLPAPQAYGPVPAPSFGQHASLMVDQTQRPKPTENPDGCPLDRPSSFLHLAKSLARSQRFATCFLHF